MLFNSVPFLAYFLPIVVAGALLLRRFEQRAACKYWLLSASAFFYGYWEWRYLLLLFGSIVVNYIIGKRLAAPDADKGKRRGLLYLGVIFNLGVLFLFKYFNFFIDNLEFLLGFEAEVFQLVLPLGISFFTFQQIAFLVDAYERKNEAEYSFIDYAIFVSFFPQLIAGPIVHHKEFVPQLKTDLFAKPTAKMFAAGLTIIIIGLFKKAVLADGLAPSVNMLFADAATGDPLTFFEAWLATLGFAGQIYFDFSGYSDIAIGLALLFGLRMPENFAAPYRSFSIIDFWRRWHITLSSFLRDYLYIPLGGNRRGQFMRYVNLMVTMLLGGLWHGAAWTFVIWGGLHGTYLTINHLFNAMTKAAAPQVMKGVRMLRPLFWVLTFVSVCFAWIYFRADGLVAANSVAAGFLGLNGFYIPGHLAAFIGLPAGIGGDVAPGSALFADRALWNDLVAAIGFTVISLAVAFGQSQKRGSQDRRLIAVACVIGFVVQAIFFGTVSEEFIYFQF